ncbi:MAG: hypothetical protein IJJ26_11085 [Victivallales bacterium]|nr:hypothetical protein [Victivallales bacterium]
MLKLTEESGRVVLRYVSYSNCVMLLVLNAVISFVFWTSSQPGQEMLCLFPWILFVPLALLLTEYSSLVYDQLFHTIHWRRFTLFGWRETTFALDDIDHVETKEIVGKYRSYKIALVFKDKRKPFLYPRINPNNSDKEIDQMVSRLNELFGTHWDPQEELVQHMRSLSPQERQEYLNKILGNK